MNQHLFSAVERALQAWMDGSRRYAAAVILGLVALAIAGGWAAAARLSVNTDSSVMISADAPYRTAGLDFQESFPGFGDRIVMLVRSPTPDEADAATTLITLQLRERTDAIKDVFAPPADPFFNSRALLYLPLQDLERLLSRLTQAAPLIKRLDADPSLDALFGALAEGAERMDLSAGAQLDAMYAALADVIRARLNGTPEPLSWQGLFASDYQVGVNGVHQRVISITPQFDFETLKPARRAVDAINEVAERMNADGRFRVETFVTGDPVLRSEELETVSRGILLSFSASFVAVAILLLFAFRSPALVVAALASIVISICITAGIASMLYDALNLISAAVVVLLVGLGVDFAIHLILHVQEERRAGSDIEQALKHTGHEIGAALALTAPTTAIAFLAFVPTWFVGMSQLGEISAIGVIVAFVVTISFMSAVFALLGPLRRRRGDDERLSPAPEALRRGERALRPGDPGLRTHPRTDQPGRVARALQPGRHAHGPPPVSTRRSGTTRSCSANEEALRGADDPMLSKALIGLASVHVQLRAVPQVRGRPSAAPWALLEKTDPLEARALAFAMGGLADALVRQKRFEEAEPLYRRSLDLVPGRNAGEPRERGALLGNLGSVYNQLGRYEDALPRFDRGTHACSRPATAGRSRDRGTPTAREGARPLAPGSAREGEGGPTSDRSRSAKRPSARDHPDLARTLDELGVVLLRKSDFAAGADPPRARGAAPGEARQPAPARLQPEPPGRGLRGAAKAHRGRVDPAPLPRDREAGAPRRRSRCATRRSRATTGSAAPSRSANAPGCSATPRRRSRIASPQPEGFRARWHAASDRRRCRSTRVEDGNSWKGATRLSMAQATGRPHHASSVGVMSLTESALSGGWRPGRDARSAQRTRRRTGESR